MPRDGLAGERGGVELGAALGDHSVDRHALARLDHDDRANGHLGGVHLDELAALLDVGVLRRDVHHLCDGLAALAHRVALEELSDLVEDHDGRALGHVGVGVWEEHHCKGADRCHGHEEALVERLAVRDVARRLDEHVVACDEVGDEVEGERSVDVSGRPEGAGEKPGLVHNHDDGKDGDGDDDPVAPPTLLLVHLTLL